MIISETGIAVPFWIYVQAMKTNYIIAENVRQKVIRFI
jgi:hypothetical protein